MTSTTKELQERFWAHFARYLEAHPSPGLSSKKPAMPHIMKLAGGKGWEVAARFNVRGERIEADLTLGGDSAKQNFDRIQAAFGGIGDTKMGSAVGWEREPVARPNYPAARKPESSIYCRMAIEPNNESKWDEYSDWLIKRSATLLRWHDS